MFESDRKNNKRMDEFLKEIQGLCEQYRYSIGHEDGHGAFIIYPIEEDPDGKWLGDAYDKTNDK